MILAGKNQLHLHILLEVLQRYYKLAILGNLNMPSNVKPKFYYQNCRTILCLSTGKKSTASPRVPRDTAKICKLILGTLDMPG